MFVSNKKKYLSKFRLKYKAYSKLKNQNNLGLWRDLKEKFLINPPLDKTSKFSRLIFGSSFEFAELIIHQYCVDRFLSNWLGGQILENIADHSNLINTPLPNKWIEILTENKFRLNKLSCNIKFFIVIILSLIVNIKFIFKVFYNSLNYKRLIFNNSVHFVNLKYNNLPPNTIKNNYDLISWYIQSNAFINGITNIYHDVYEKKPFKYNDINIASSNLPIGTCNNKYQLFKFIIWSIKSIFFTIFDLLRGNFWHALILGEAAKNKIIELTEIENLSIAYYFPYSSACYRPMWTYAANTKGIGIVSYFYSTFEQPKVNYNNSSQKFEFYLYNWPITLVWNERQLNLIQDNCKYKVNASIVGPIWTIDSNEILNKNNLFTIVIFDTQIHKKYYHFGVSTLSDYYEYNINVNLRFLKDIIEIAEMYNINIIHKTKRDIGNRSLNSYERLLKKIKIKSNYIQYDSSVSPLKLIQIADVVISSPFTSTAIIAKTLNKPSFFYDPVIWVQKNDLASHGIPIIHGFNDLKENILKILENNHN